MLSQMMMVVIRRKMASVLEKRPLVSFMDYFALLPILSSRASSHCWWLQQIEPPGGEESKE